MAPSSVSGLVITVTGPVGAGKTVITRLIQKVLETVGFGNVVVLTPGIPPRLENKLQADGRYQDIDVGTVRQILVDHEEFGKMPITLIDTSHL